MLDDYVRIYLIISENKILNRTNIDKFILKFKNCQYELLYNRDCLSVYNSKHYHMIRSSDLVITVSYDNIIIFKNRYSNNNDILLEFKNILTKFSRSVKIKSFLC